MTINWFFIYAVALLETFVVALALTALTRRLAIRWGFLDHPGERKMHAEPIPLMGGVAIFAAFCGVIGFNLLALWMTGGLGHEWVSANILGFFGVNVMRKLAGIIAGAFIIFGLGVVDDLLALKPEIKLVGQIAASSALVFSGMRLDLFIPFPWLAALVTIVWVVGITNAMNFLDNMDGLSGGISIIAAFSFFLCLAPGGQTFICVLLMVFAGAVAGFLFHNLHPARIFMGDAGAMFCGYLLATVSVLGTFYAASTPSRTAIFAPLLALSVPIFDMVSVVIIRWRRGESIMKGDKRHFSHRLVEIGMTPRQAVEFIYIVAVVTGLGAALLNLVDFTGALIILAQTIGIFSLIVLLMNAHARRGRGENG